MLWLCEVKVGWIKSKSNCVVLIHVKKSLPSNILSPDLKKKMPAYSFCIQGVSFLQLAFYNLSVVSVRKEKRISFLSFSLNKMPLGKIAVFGSRQRASRKEHFCSMVETVTMATSHQGSSNFSQTFSTQEAFFHSVDRVFASVSKSSLLLVILTHSIREMSRCHFTVPVCLIVCC